MAAHLTTARVRHQAGRRADWAELSTASQQPYAASRSVYLEAKAFESLIEMFAAYE
jgi:ABC-type transporter lipoprotein component MlaA